VNVACSQKSFGYARTKSNCFLSRFAFATFTVSASPNWYFL